jgi:hypothetical protein
MFYQCDECEAIHKTRTQAEECCPREAREVPDEFVEICHCEHTPCAVCLDTGWRQKSCEEVMKS